MVAESGASIADVVLKHELEEALFHEAELLDAHDYRAWLDLMTDDVVYWMPIRSTRTADDRAHEFTAFGEAAYFDEDRTTLALRIEKHLSGAAWSEDPPSRTRHCISNVRVRERHENGDVTVTSNTIVYRCRLDTDEDWWVGRRVDRLRKVDDRWKIARREIYLDQTVIMSKNLTTFL